MTTFHSGNAIFIPQVEINVSDLHRSVTFYERVIGLRVIERIGERTVALGVGEEPILFIHALEHAQHRRPKQTGLYHIALLLPTRESLAVTFRHLMAEGIALGAADHAVSEALYVSDPDGNGIELYADTDFRQWRWVNDHVQMTTERLDREALLELSEGIEWTGLPSGTKMGHLHLHVHNLREARPFYEALGFSVVSDVGTALFMSSERYHHHVAVNIWQGEDATPPPPHTVGLHRALIQYPTEAALQRTVEALHRLHATVVGVDDRYETYDPSNNRFTLQVKE